VLLFSSAAPGWFSWAGKLFWKESGEQRAESRGVRAESTGLSVNLELGRLPAWADGLKGRPTTAWGTAIIREVIMILTLVRMVLTCFFEALTCRIVTKTLGTVIIREVIMILTLVRMVLTCFLWF
jgi:hypothetical protein